MTKANFLLIILYFSSIGFAYADGCYFPSKAFKKLPEISAQRVLISYEENHETLLISSALNSESQKLGWLIPLPSVPKSIEKVSPGVLKSLSFFVQPKITHDLFRDVFAGIIIAGIFIIGCHILLFKTKYFLDFLIVVVITALLSALTVPSLMGTGKPRISTINIEKSARVGNYDITVLRAKKSRDISDWLIQNDFKALPDKALNIVQEYIKDNWIFVAIKLKREDKGNNAPHPIKMVFKTNKPVYPLKLTALSQSNPYFEIFIIGNQRYGSKFLKTEFCDKYNSKDYTPRTNSEKLPEISEKYKVLKYYEGINSNSGIGHSEITNLMNENSILTKLSGNIPFEKMLEDIYFSKMNFEPHQEHFYTVFGAVKASLVVCIKLIAIMSIIFIIMLKIKKTNQTAIKLNRKIYLLCFLTSIAVSGIYYTFLPKLKIDETHSEKLFFNDYFYRKTSSIMERIIKDSPSILELEKESLIKTIQKEFATREVQNLLQGGKIIYEDTPGNFILKKEKGTVIITFFDRIGKKIIFEYPNCYEYP
jgi:hypothetical protein